ncbi:MAG: EAL domain-containing protein [Nitriliruptoraceae bacterium]
MSALGSSSSGPLPWWQRSRWGAIFGLAGLWLAGGLIARLVGVGEMLEVHLLYVPVVLAALRFGIAGGVVVGLMAAATASGIDGLWWDNPAPEVVTFVVPALHGLGFVLVGLIVGAGVRAMRTLHQRDLTNWWDSELAQRPRAGDEPDSLTDEAVRHAVTTRDFYPIFQPIYRLEDGWLFAVEALTRFDSDPPISPSRWFARAADLGLGVELEIAAVEKSITSAHKFPDRVTLSVNTSAAAIMDESLLAVVDKAVRPVMLELTELEPVTDYARLAEMLQRYRQAGARIAVDNVGASMTSLRHIARLDPEVIKLDRSLTNDARGDPVRWALTKRLLHFARTSGALLVVEGIEDPEDLDHWRSVGVHAAQGYLLGRPGMRTIVEQFEFPKALKRRAESDVNRPRRVMSRRPRDIVSFDDKLAPSQLTDEPAQPGRPETVVDPLRRGRTDE